ncbi:DNA polymerase III subunit gamma/tau [Porphyromonas sp. oral taxon 275]|uniref:DNA polymerase III subunit gamma/tau n=1 Tax=Porphyromonas sp. oral taxon 275 TaxID=712435 RepID=UPI001BA7298B|nr:DNA polymerase III subunit gamma/tau [Porphyromonas sp. oral taxon 275]QUB43354.1 DNA polymerase III subunit gamma/tau [Porphyromonas sp. oral taxon 275]
MSDQYIVSARKYRPDSFHSIVGQGAMASTLRTAVLERKLAHAYLFCGPRGVGKTTAARVLAKTINCTNLQPDGEACNACESCRAFNEQRSFNIFELDAASNNSVDDIRTLTEQVAMPPALGRYKVYIIDEVHMLSAAAFNAFLKTLEEPPSYAIFILATTEKHKILPTILSRCQIYDFKRITVGDITQHLRYVAEQEGIEADEAALGLIAEKADGGMRDALSMFDRIASFSSGHISYQHALESLNVLDYGYFIRIYEQLLSGDFRALLLLVDELLARGFEGQLILNGLAAFTRDLLVVQHPDTAQLLEKPEGVARQYQSLAQRCTAAQLFGVLKVLVAADQQWRAATSKRLLLELSLLQLVALFPSSGELAAPAPEPSAASRTSPSPATPKAAPAPAPTPSAAPTAAPVSAPPPPVPAAEPQSAPPAAPQPASTPAPAPPAAAPEAPAPVSPEPPKRRRPIFGGQRAALQQAQQQAETSVAAPTLEEHEPFTEEQLQRAWMRYIEEVLPSEQIVCRSILLESLPHQLSATEAETALPPSSAAREAIEAIYPQLLSYLRGQLHNHDLTLLLREKNAEEQARLAFTPEDKLKKLAEVNPQVLELKERLGLRFT